jgi:outer membrane protein OmpA-like peptidoglycan-associated protein
MIKSGKAFISLAAAVVIISLAASGCATKKYVSKQINPVKQQMSHNQKQTNDKIAWLTNKQQTDVSQLNERIATTDQRVAEVATTAQGAASAAEAAQGTASRAMEASDANKTSIEANATAITDVKNSMNYQMVDETEVLFAFNKTALRPAARDTLDKVIAKAQGMPRSVIELSGFTDRVGTARYNMELSRRRAWAVQRYLVEHNVPTRSIHVVGLGEAEGKAPRERGRAMPDQADRRVTIKVFGAGELPSTPSDQQ